MNERIAKFRHDELSVYGIGQDQDAGHWRALALQLVATDALRRDPQHGGMALGPNARAILKGEQPVSMREQPERPKRARRTRGSAAPAGSPADDPLFQQLRQLRRRIAAESGVPPYVVFSDASLREMAAVKPASLDAFGEITGVGAAKLESYGAAFCRGDPRICGQRPLADLDGGHGRRRVQRLSQHRLVELALPFRDDQRRHGVADEVGE